MSDLGRAFVTALAAHRGQKDKAGEPYIAHLVRVAERLEDETEQTVALLHDIVEDCGMPLEDLRAAFGDRIADAVDAMTRRPGEAYIDYLSRVKANPLSAAVKLADVKDNGDPARLARLEPATRERLTVKYAQAVAALTPPA